MKYSEIFFVIQKFLAYNPPTINASYGPARACGTRLTPSAIAYYPGGRARKMGPLAVLPHH